MPATQKDYDAGSAAALDVINTYENKYVPEMFQGQIAAYKAGFGADIAKAVIDAVDKERASS